MEAKHTPTPYTTQRDANGELALWHGNDNLLCGESDLSLEEREANAAFIVKACNNFHKMLQAMKDAHDVLFMPDRGSYEGTAESMHAANAEYAQATLKIAIAKAEEEE